MLAFFSVGGARISALGTLSAVISTRLSFYLSATVALLLFSKIGIDSKCELHEIQTGNAQDSERSENN